MDWLSIATHTFVAASFFFAGYQRGAMHMARKFEARVSSIEKRTSAALGDSYDQVTNFEQKWK